MPSYNRQSPVELLASFASLHGVDRTGAQYICGFIKRVLEKRGYTIKIEDGTYSLEHIKENVKSNKEKSMKNIFIKFENELLVKYVATELRNKLGLTQRAPKATIDAGKHCGLLIKPGTIAELRYHNIHTEDAKVFVVTKAASADVLIEEVVKEYNKVENKSFTLGGSYNGNTIPVVVYKDMVSFNNEYLTFDKFIELRNSLLGNVGGFAIGGDTTILLTHGNVGTKVYVQKNEFKPIIDTILCRLDG